MNRRNFTRASFGIIGAASLGTAISTANAQTPATTSSPDVWESSDDPIKIEWDTEVFGEAATSGVTGEWCVLRIPDIDRFLSFIIMLEDKFPTDAEGLRDIVENDPVLDYPTEPDTVSRINVVEDNGAFGVLYQAELEAASDTWSYSEFIPAEDGEHRTIKIWIASRRSKLDRDFMEAAVSSVTINGEQAVRAIDIADLFDQVEAIDIDDAV